MLLDIVVEGNMATMLCHIHNCIIWTVLNDLGVHVPARWSYGGLGPSHKSAVRLQGQPVGGVRQPEKSEDQGVFIHIWRGRKLQFLEH